MQCPARARSIGGARGRLRALRVRFDVDGRGVAVSARSDENGSLGACSRGFTDWQVLRTRVNWKGFIFCGVYNTVTVKLTVFRWHFKESKARYLLVVDEHSAVCTYFSACWFLVLQGPQRNRPCSRQACNVAFEYTTALVNQVHSASSRGELYAEEQSSDLIRAFDAKLYKLASSIEH
eukprot:IDg14500t1